MKKFHEILDFVLEHVPTHGNPTLNAQVAKHRISLAALAAELDPEAAVENAVDASEKAAEVPAIPIAHLIEHHESLPAASEAPPANGPSAYEAIEKPAA